MHNNIEQILEDLYQSDPSLRQHEGVLRKLVVELMEVKPNTQFDEQFRQDLRRRLMSLAETKEKNPTLLNSIFMLKFKMVGAGVALVALLAVTGWYLNGLNSPLSKSGVTSLLSGPKITKAGENAFGSLSNVQNAGRGQGGGGNGNEAAAPMTATDSAVGMGGGTSDAKMIAPQAYNFRYVYKGDELTLSEDNVEVLKRVKGDESNGLSDFLNRITLGLVNLNSFGNAKLQSFNFAEDQDLGYMVNVSLTEGSININENWAKWQKMYMPCAAELSIRPAGDCQPKRIQPSDIPADNVLIDAANQFLADHGIPTEVYGQPFVNKDFMAYYEAAEDKANYWLPDVVNVVYPLQLNGQSVFDESGNRNGMNVSIRISPEVKVSGVWELTTQNYQSSSYQSETSTDRIMKLVEKGGFRNYYYVDQNAKTVDVEVGTPQISYVKLWNYANGANEELLVPALIFPVTKEPTVGTNYWYRHSVVIPLVKEILDNENQNGGPIMPMVDVPAADAVKR